MQSRLCFTGIRWEIGRTYLDPPWENGLDPDPDRPDPYPVQNIISLGYISPGLPTRFLITSIFNCTPILAKTEHISTSCRRSFSVSKGAQDPNLNP
jgi:hypothetical protein